MFGADPIDLTNPDPYSALSYYGHLAIGLIALVAMLIAFAARKGGKRHILSGKAFLVAMLVVCVTSAALLAVTFIPPLFVAMVTAAYAGIGAYLALKQGSRIVRSAEYTLFAAELIALAVFMYVGINAALQGLTPMVGPILIAVIPLVLLAGDVHWFVNSGRRAQLRIRRHLTRMIWTAVVVVRAPLVEIVAGGLPVPEPVVIIGPFVVGLGLLWYFRKRYDFASPRT